MSETIKISVDLKLVPTVLHSGLFFIHFCEKTTTTILLQDSRVCMGSFL